MLHGPVSVQHTAIRYYFTGGPNTRSRHRFNLYMERISFGLVKTSRGLPS